MNIRSVCKRDGRIVDFDIQKVQNAIYSALKSVNDNDIKQQRTEELLRTLSETYANQVRAALSSSSDTDTPKVEQIQDVVENVLIRNNETLASKHYILYRNDRTKVREMNTTIMNTMKRITFNDSKNVDLMRENANIDGDSAMGTMLRYGSETSKEFVKSFMLRPEIAKAQIDGDIHIHDMDFYNLTCTCVTEDTKTVLKTSEGTFGVTFDYFNKYFADDNYQTVSLNDVQVLSVNGEFVPVVACTRRLLNADEKVYYIRTNNGALSLTGEHRVPIRDYSTTTGSTHTRLTKVSELHLGDILVSDFADIRIDDYHSLVVSNNNEHDNTIIGLSYRDYNSFVYDIQTANEYYDANGYIIHNCVQIDTKKLFKNGFSTGHGVLREPNDIISASALTCIAIQANQNDMHGGQSIPALDYYLAPYIKKTFVKQLQIILDSRDEICTDCVITAIKEFDNEDKSLLSDESIEHIISILEHFGVKDANKVVNKAISYTDTATHQAMEAMVHNLNSMQSRAGAQVPFSSLNFGTDTSAEGRMVSKNLLIATDEGLGNGETPIFPISIFKLKEGINYNETDPNYDLFKLACRVSAKRLFPNFSNLDAPFNKMYYKEGNIDTEASYMGCRTRVVANNYDKNNEIVTGRGNVSFTSINLPRLAIKAEHNVKTFIDLLDEEMELVFTQLLDRFEIQGRRRAKNYPFLMGQGIWINSDSLAPDDEVKEVIKNGSLTTGFIGLAECLTALIGQHHGQSEDAQELGLMIIGYMRDKCDKKSAETGLNFTLIATPAEGLSGRFVKLDKKRYGIIEGVTDKDYYTNSMHIPVSFPISIYDKIRLEAPYHAFTNGGHITYVEVDGDPLQNLDAFEDIIRLGHDMGLGYFSINHPVDRDSVCGYTGIIGDTCPRCGRHEGEGIELEKLLQLKKKYPDITIPYIEEYKENYLS